MLSLVRASASAVAEFLTKCLRTVVGQLRGCLSVRGLIETGVASFMVGIVPAAAAAFATVPLSRVETQWAKTLVMPAMFGLMLFLALHLPTLAVVLTLVGLHRANTEFVTRMRWRLKLVST